MLEKLNKRVKQSIGILSLACFLSTPIGYTFSMSSADAAPKGQPPRYEQPKNPPPPRVQNKKKPAPAPAPKKQVQKKNDKRKPAPPPKKSDNKRPGGPKNIFKR